VRISQLQYFVESLYACSQHDEIAARHLTESGKIRGSIEAGEKTGRKQDTLSKGASGADPITVPAEALVRVAT